eukprot:gene24060-biopygen16389
MLSHTSCAQSAGVTRAQLPEWSSPESYGGLYGAKTYFLVRILRPRMARRGMVDVISFCRSDGSPGGREGCPPTPELRHNSGKGGRGTWEGSGHPGPLGPLGSLGQLVKTQLDYELVQASGIKVNRIRRENTAADAVRTRAAPFSQTELQRAVERKRDAGKGEPRSGYWGGNALRWRRAGSGPLLLSCCRATVVLSCCRALSVLSCCRTVELSGFWGLDSSTVTSAPRLLATVVLSSHCRTVVLSSHCRTVVLSNCRTVGILGTRQLDSDLCLGTGHRPALK